MYNGIGLQTPRGSGTNGYVTRNLSAVRKTKEKVPDYKTKDDAAVRPYDAELIEHERRRQAEVRCMELRELLEEQEIPEEEIEKKVDAFRAKLLAEKKLSVAKDASGRAMVKDSHELSMAQESKNERAKDAFGIRTDFIPGSSFEAKQPSEKSAASTSSKDTTTEPSADAKVSSKHEDRSRKRKKSKKSSKRSSSSSSSSSSSDEEEKRKKRKKDRKKKSKKSHHHRREEEGSPDVRRSSSTSCSEESHNSNHHHHDESDDNGEIVTKYSVAILDIPSHGEICANTIDLSERSHSPVDIVGTSLIPVLQTTSECISIHDNTPNSRKSSRSPCSEKSRSHSGSQASSRSRSPHRSRSRSPSVTRSAHSSLSRSSRSTSFHRSKSPSVSSRSRSKSSSRSHSKSRSRSRSSSSSGTASTASSRSARSIPRRRGSPSFLDRRRITSARKRPIPYKRRNGCEWDVSTTSSDSS